MKRPKCEHARILVGWLNKMKTKIKNDLSNGRRLEEEIHKVVKRIQARTDKEYWEEFLTGLVKNNAIPLELLEQIPEKAFKIGKSRFDQIYDACMYLNFPDYDPELVEFFLGEVTEENENLKVWRVLFPERFNILSVLIKANSYQHAFSLACDYACRLSLRMFKKIPNDLTIRIMYMSERALKRHLDVRWANRIKKQEIRKQIGKKRTDKQINGARLCALGHPFDKNYSIMKYTESHDNRMLKKKNGLVKESMVEHESFKKEDLI